MTQTTESDPNFSQQLEQAYWDRKLALLKVNSGMKMPDLDAAKLESELILLESFRYWLKTGRTFSLESAKRLLAKMKNVGPL